MMNEIALPIIDDYVRLDARPMGYWGNNYSDEVLSHFRAFVDESFKSKKITARERQVILLRMEGGSATAIGKKLGIAHGTVNATEERTMDKLVNIYLDQTLCLT